MDKKDQTCFDQTALITSTAFPAVASLVHCQQKQDKHQVQKATAIIHS